MNDGLPVTVVWDGQFLDSSVWVVAENSQRKDLGAAFIRFATRAENMATLASLIPYGPVRHSAITRIGLHARSNVPMLHHMPTAPSNLRRAIRADSTWYARTEALRQRWFEAWLAQEQVP